MIAGARNSHKPLTELTGSGHRCSSVTRVARQYATVDRMEGVRYSYQNKPALRHHLMKLAERAVLFVMRDKGDLHQHSGGPEERSFCPHQHFAFCALRVDLQYRDGLVDDIVQPHDVGALYRRDLPSVSGVKLSC